MKAITDDAAGIVEAALSLHQRGYAPGNSGNLSVRVDDSVIVTPTGSSLGRLDADSLAVVSLSGEHLSGPPPSKETGIHLAMYRSDPTSMAVVHLHSLGAAAASCLPVEDPHSIFAPMTAYQRLRLGNVALAGFAMPGTSELIHEVERVAAFSRTMLLANHGSLAARATLDDAVDSIEQLEQTAMLTLLLHGRTTSPLPSDS